MGTLYLVRALLPEFFGELALVLAIIGMLDLCSPLAVPVAYVQEKETDTLFQSAYGLAIRVGFIPVFLAIAIFYPVTILYNEKIALFVVLVSLSRPFTSMSSVLLARMEKGKEFGKSYIIRGSGLVLSLATATLMAANGFEEKSLIARELLGGIFVYIAARLYYRRAIPWDRNKEESKRLLKYSITQMFSRGSELLYMKVPLLLIGSLYGTVTLGLFVQAFYLVSIMNTALAPMTQQVALVFYSEAKNNSQSPHKQISIISWVSLALALPVSLVLLIYPTEVLSILYGEKWLDASGYLQGFAVFGCILPIFNNLKAYFYSVNKSILIGWTYIVCLMIALCLVQVIGIEYIFSASMAFGLVVLMFKKSRVQFQ